MVGVEKSCAIFLHCKKSASCKQHCIEHFTQQGKPQSCITKWSFAIQLCDWEEIASLLPQFSKFMRFSISVINPWIRITHAYCYVDITIKEQQNIYINKLIQKIQ